MGHEFKSGEVGGPQRGQSMDHDQGGSTSLWNSTVSDAMLTTCRRHVNEKLSEIKRKQLTIYRTSIEHLSNIY